MGSSTLFPSASSRNATRFFFLVAGESGGRGGCDGECASYMFFHTLPIEVPSFTPHNQYLHPSQSAYLKFSPHPVGGPQPHLHPLLLGTFLELAEEDAVVPGTGAAKTDTMWMSRWGLGFRVLCVGGVVVLVRVCERCCIEHFHHSSLPLSPRDEKR